MIAAETLSIPLPGSFAPNATLARGDGNPIVYLHGPFGQEWTGFHDDLAEKHRVFAPSHPGGDEPDDLRHLDGLFDLILYYDDLFTTLGLGKVDLIGHSFGGMIAAEIAATYPERARRLVLIDALGLWRDDTPVADHVLTPPEKQVGLLYKDPTKPEVAARLALPDDPKARNAAIVRSFGAVASTSHFVWPIPERGLAKRLRRVKAPTLVVWGKEDALVPLVYAHDFVRAIHGAKLVVVEGAGHVPQVEQRSTTAKAVLEFLA
jgi:pimeloyl-ACP methyl ester carboxylesterase